MSDADLFRQYAKEAMHVSSKVKDENEKQTDLSKLLLI
jgi:hypothetical protein